jgi:hypothetical protein
MGFGVRVRIQYPTALCRVVSLGVVPYSKCNSLNRPQTNPAYARFSGHSRPEYEFGKGL